MQKVIALQKEEGETPLEALEKFRSENKEYEGVPMTYAGRLDPMASGALLVLAGEKTKKKDEYLGLDKEYEFEVLFGYATDTYDILGKILHSNVLTNVGMKNLASGIKTKLEEFKGEIVQKYPMYSSKTVNGKPLFAYAQEGEEVERPERKVFIKQIELVGLREINSEDLLREIKERIGKVKGNFRQSEIIKTWEENLKPSVLYKVARFKIECSSGTYVRTIANDLGERLGVPALAYSIKRTRVGSYKI